MILAKSNDFTMDTSIERIEDISEGTKFMSGPDACFADTTVALIVAYNGSSFSGFAKQPGQSTVQGEIEHALSLIFRRDVSTICAGRTDSGVHAVGQVVSFDVECAELEQRSEVNLLRSLNALTAEGITIKQMDRKPFGFSARFDAKARRYRYFFSTSVTPPMFMNDFSWHIGPLDVEAMQAGADYLIGEHDFKSFCLAKSAIDKPTCRYIAEISFEKMNVFEDEILAMSIEGNAFLHSMVRTIAGSLVAIGKGKRASSWMSEVLNAQDRRAAGECAPAKGLVFWEVAY